MFNKDAKIIHISSTGKRNMLVEYLISQGIDVKVYKSTGEIRGMKAEYIIVDELVEGSDL